FFLLAHDCGCEGLKGMCCMNVSDNLESIYPSIQKLKDSVFKLQKHDRDFFKKWLRDL
ncbi:hypothetical protein N325_08664, partial [Colius striatus]